MRLYDRLILKPLPIGIDIGASGVRLLQFHASGRRLGVRAAVHVPIATAHERPMTGSRAIELADAVRDAVATGGFWGKRCVVSFDNRLVRSRLVRHPPMPDEELTRAVNLDASSRLGFAEHEAAEVGWLRAGAVRQQGDPRDEIIVVGVPTEPVQEIIFALARTGLNPLAIEPSFVACARAMTRKLRRADDQTVVRVIADIGLRTTGVTITRGQSVTFYKQLEIGGHQLNQAAAERLGLDPASALELRVQRARVTGATAPSDPRIDRALFEAARPILGDLGNEIGLCLRYHGVTFRGSKPESCLIVGGEAYEPRIAEIVASVIHLPTEVGDPFAGADALNSLPEELSVRGAAWATAAGLGIRGREREKAPKSDRRESQAPARPGRIDAQQGRAAA